MIERLEKAGGEPAYSGADEADAQLRRELATCKRVVKETGIKPD